MVVRALADASAHVLRISGTKVIVDDGSVIAQTVQVAVVVDMLLCKAMLNGIFDIIARSAIHSSNYIAA